MGRGSGLVLIALAWPSVGWAGAWPLPAGDGQAIAKIEWLEADQGWDLDGVARDLPMARTDETASLFIEYGLTDRLTLHLRTEYQTGRDAFVDYEGRGPSEIGLRWAPIRTDDWVVASQVAYAQAGDSRNAGYAQPGVGESDWEARLLIGHTLDLDRPGFVELQLARRQRDGLPDETRLDLTVGIQLAPRWHLMTQVFAGEADGVAGAAWVNSEVSVARDFGDWRLQAGWREAVAGRESPVQSGPVLAVWRRF